MKMGIALPHTFPMYYKQFVESFVGMAKPADCILLMPNCDGPIDSVRNELCQQALLQGCDHIFWCDTDQTYPPDTIERLYAHGLPIVAAKVHRRNPPYDPLLKRLKPGGCEKGQDPYIDIDVDEWAYNLNDNPDYPLVEVDATGFGCNLMSIEVIENIKKPWFMFDLYQKPPLGEDFYFWEKARGAGYKIHVDVSIDIGHITTAVVKKNTFFAYRRESMG